MSAVKKPETTIPEGVKQPQDRKPAATPETLTAKVNGVEFTVDAEVLDDFELLDDMSRLDDGDASRLPSLLRRMLGSEQYRTALESCRDKDTGRVSVEAGAEFVGELMGALDPNS